MEAQDEMILHGAVARAEALREGYENWWAVLRWDTETSSPLSEQTHLLDEEPCVICGRKDQLVVEYPQGGFACVDCIAKENGEEVREPRGE